MEQCLESPAACKPKAFLAVRWEIPSGKLGHPENTCRNSPRGRGNEANDPDMADPESIWILSSSGKKTPLIWLYKKTPILGPILNPALKSAMETWWW